MIQCKSFSYVYGGPGHDDYILIESKNNQYYFFYWYKGTKAGEEFESQTKDVSQLEVRVWEHFPKIHHLNLFNSEKLSKEIVDIAGFDYLSLESVKKRHKTNRVVYSICIIVFWVASTLLYTGLFLNFFTKKKKRKTKTIRGRFSD